jgi:tetratricopeptide (TPR) repeat protein
MGRFAKLEMGSSPAQADQSAVTPDLDEQQCLSTGADKFRSGFYEDAIAEYSRALQFNRDLASAWVGQIRCLLGSYEYAEAATWCDRALERFANTPDLLACKGLALTYLGDSTGPKYLDLAIEMRTPSEWVWLARGQSLLTRKNGDTNAARCFLKALESSGGDWHTDLRIGIAYNTEHRYAQARSHLMQAAREAPQNPLCAYQLGVMHEGVSDTASAISSYERALNLRHGYKEAMRALERARKTDTTTKMIRRLWQRT